MHEGTAVVTGKYFVEYFGFPYATYLCVVKGSWAEEVAGNTTGGYILTRVGVLEGFW